jgi:rod shape-determining protein MreD
MPTLLRQIIIYAVVILIQVIMNNYVNLGPMVYICLVPLLVIYLPLDQKNYLTLFIAFGLGLLIDILSDGVLGLNAGAATLVALVYKPLFYPIFQKNNYSKKYILPIRESGLWHHVLYLLIILAIYFLFYIAFDGLAKTTLLVSLIRYLVNILVNLAIALAIDLTLFNRS